MNPANALAALERQPAPDSFVLSPDGRGLFYFQGAPWPRLLFRSLDEPGSEARMVAPFVPFRRRPPRVAPSGEAVYFTAIGGTESRHRIRSRSVASGETSRTRRQN